MLLEVEEGTAADEFDEDEAGTFSVCESSTRVQPSRSYKANIMLPQSLAFSRIKIIQNNFTANKRNIPVTRSRSGTVHKLVFAHP
jgi:hypothetical protein